MGVASGHVDGLPQAHLVGKGSLRPVTNVHNRRLVSWQTLDRPYVRGLAVVCLKPRSESLLLKAMNALTING